MTKHTCPAALIIAGKHFPCQQMDHMAEGSTSHDGWAHSNRDAEALWYSDLDLIPTTSPDAGETEGEPA